MSPPCEPAAGPRARRLAEGLDPRPVLVGAAGFVVVEVVTPIQEWWRFAAPLTNKLVFPTLFASPGGQRFGPSGLPRRFLRPAGREFRSPADTASASAREVVQSS